MQVNRSPLNFTWRDHANGDIRKRPDHGQLHHAAAASVMQMTSSATGSGYPWEPRWEPLERVYLSADHMAELSDIRSRTVSGREPLFLVGRKLVELGYGVDGLLAG